MSTQQQQQQQQQHPHHHPHHPPYHDIEEAARQRRTSHLAVHPFPPPPPVSSSLSSQELGQQQSAPSSVHHNNSLSVASTAVDALSGVIPLTVRSALDRAPPSRGSAVLSLPLTIKHLQQSSSGGGSGSDPHHQQQHHHHQHQQPQQQHNLPLLHPVLNKVPLQFRFGLTGLLSNVLFMVAYNASVLHFSQSSGNNNNYYKASTIYSVVYLLFIPISHLLTCLLVFGWPPKYVPSLVSNFPIGLTALAIGSFLTSYLDSIDFNYRIEEYIRDNYSFSKMPARNPVEGSDEFYSSLLVLAVTSLWTYALSVYINAPPAVSEKKQL